MKLNLSFNMVALILVVNIILITLEYFAKMPIIGTAHLLVSAFVMRNYTKPKKNSPKYLVD